VNPTTDRAALDRARNKAYWRLLPLLFICYVIAYVDRANVSLAKLTMSKDLPEFDNAVIGFGAGMFFWGYILLEVPGTLLVERWSARRMMSRIMVTWGIMAALTAAVTTPMQFYCVRFGLGLAEAGFFPGVIVFLTHWFPNRDRSRAVALFLIATPVAQIISPKISHLLLRIGTDELIGGVTVHHPELLGLEGWQWMYIFWGVPAVALGFVVLFLLPDRPRDAKWLTEEERDALEQQLQIEKERRSKGKRMTMGEAFRNPKVLLLAIAFCCSVTANYGYEFFFPSILKAWYSLNLNEITWLVILPPCLALGSQLFVGWNSDRTGERRCHAAFSIIIGLVALGLAPLTQGNLILTVVCFMIFFAGVKGYQPAFWALPSLFLTESAAAASIGFINSIGQIGGFMGPYLLGSIEKNTGSFAIGIYVLTASMTVSALIILGLGLGHRPPKDESK
jgi:ACS family tartrate transporter-like MFS transporter